MPYADRVINLPLIFYRCVIVSIVVIDCAIFAKFAFLVACTRLYKTLCGSVGPSVRRLDLILITYFAVSRLAETAPAPAQPHATGIAVYTALLFWLSMHLLMPLRALGLAYKNVPCQSS